MKKNIFFTLILVAFMTLSIVYAPEVKSQVQTAVNNCLTVIIPSLYGFMVLSDLAVRTGIYKIISKPFFIFAKLFNIPSNFLAILIISHIGGYPVGIKLICDLLDKKEIDKKTARRLSCFCVSSGPAFIVGTVSGVLYHSSEVAWLLFLSITFSNFIIAFVTGLFAEKVQSKKEKININISWQSLNNAVETSAAVMFKICAVILMCSVGIGLLKTALNSSFLNSFIDVTNIVFVQKNNYNNLPLIAALLSFGGICVALQIFGIAGNKINMTEFLLFRLIAASLSFFICKLLSPHLIQTVETSTIHISEQSNVIPSLALVLMSFIILTQGVAQKSSHT
jgi:hypothetical protein